MVKEIKLGGKRANGKVTLVDDEFYDNLSKYNWWCNSDGYAVRIEYENRKYKRQIFMHKEILKVKKGFQVDHINRDILDNRINNLREVTPSQNQMNRGVLKTNITGFKGVSFDKSSSKFRATITKEGKTQHLGFYETSEEAACAYNIKARQMYGEYALLNKITIDESTFRFTTIDKTCCYRGVTKLKNGGVFVASISCNKKQHYLGRFDNPHDAARMYNFWAMDLFGELANLNVIKEEVTQ